MEASRMYLLVLHVFSVLNLSVTRILSQKRQRTMEQCLYQLYLAVTRPQCPSEPVTMNFGHYTAQLVIFTIMCVEHMVLVLFL
jgi:hypothetical protein